MLDAETLRHWLDYDPVTGVFRWRVKPNRAIRIGAQAGCLALGYVTIGLAGRNYMAHRLAWLHMTGEWPDREIDHIDRCGSNNAWSNLRQATRSQNLANTAARNGRLKGVSFSQGRNKFEAQIMLDQKKHHLGRYDSAEEAHAAYCAAASRLFGEFARVA